ncbi:MULTISPECIES: DUF202 domain-containing protein [Ramlibacter]|uniref:DUF202 domain-containing protein n=1 Tax=Ramlibacter aquaticus TaxID=2780094 RepID=A0ABR9SKI3_9BURK|nr:MULTISPECIES: DUF202 domain-containing protein [Ramlibacter]MBE7942272.1 DUF202 domain-containing protein [Ramlibacter aquaticus]
MKDPGLQPERTALAWNRSMLAVLGNGMLLLRVALQLPGAWLGVVLILVLAALAGCLRAGRARRQVLTKSTPQSAAPAAAMQALTGSALLCCCAATLELLLAMR